MRRYDRYWIVACVGITAGAAAGCESIPSSIVVDTDQIYADIQVVGGDDNTEVDVLLREGGEDGNVLPLVPGDRLRATKNGKTTNRFTKTVDGSYLGTLKGSEGGAKVTVALDRSEADSADNSTAVLPEAFTLSLDMESDEIVRGNNVHIAWDGTSDQADEIAWSVEGECIDAATGTTKDDGEVAIGTQQIQVSDGWRGSTCEVTITLERVGDGVIDSKFGKGGKVTAYQRRTVVFTSTPGIEEE
ncbi:MAG: hypothetical protein JW940_20325 [Polyangiaceae bacterium]|nr:hypothetical protein [Polyangiaceae bacterium]